MFMTDIFPAIETGQIKALWLVATNPLTSMPNTPRIRKTLQKLEFMVVQDAYADVESTQYAHMYLPAALWGEKEGCFTNTERRVNLVRKVMEPHGDAKPDLWIFNELAKRYEQGRKMNFPPTPAGVFEEMRALSKGRMLDYSGMDHDKIEAQRGIQWPCTEGAEKGNQRLYTDGVFQHPDGKAKLLAMPFIDNNEKPDDDYPFWLNSGRVVEHFHTRTRTGKIGNVNKFSPTPYMEMNPDAAARLNIPHMSYARLISRRGDAVVMVQHTQRVPPDMVFIPFHFHECVNRLTLGLLDPYSRQPAFKQCSVKIEPAPNQQAAAAANVAARSF
jgi:predicted molibdopterin-dependent oxidoreductase YjgC